MSPGAPSSPYSLLLAALHLLSLFCLVLSHTAVVVRASLARDDSPRLERNRVGKGGYAIASGL